MLPNNAYQKWQLLDGTIHAQARWMYERSAYDPTPVDVAVIGPSRSGLAINAPRLGRELASEGLPGNVVNFYLPETGRNTSYVIVKELLKHKRPKLIILDVVEIPSRFGHSAFRYLADPGALLFPGYLLDAHYFSDLVYLPFRQMTLFAANMDPELLGLNKKFSPVNFAGSSLDTTGSMPVTNGVMRSAEQAAPLDQLQRGSRRMRTEAHRPLLPPNLADLEFGDERHYVARIAQLAAARGVKIAFVYVPYYGGPDYIAERPFYQRLGPVWDGSFISTHPEWYADVNHLTRLGAEHFTDWLLGPVAATLRHRRQAS